MLCLTAEFGMGSGRATALWPPKKVFKFKELTSDQRWPVFVEYYTQGLEASKEVFYNSPCFEILNSTFLAEGKIRIKPHDRLVLVR